MAWTAATANYVELKRARGATLSDTIGEVYTKTFKFSFGASTNTDTIELTNCKVPAKVAILGAYVQTSNTSNGAIQNAPANSGIAVKLTTDNREFANAANNLLAASNTVALTLVAANSISLTEQTLTVTQVGAANAVGALTCTMTLVLASLGSVDAPYSTFTI
jgi:hypothetical protein